MKKLIKTGLLSIIAVTGLVGCTTEADTVSENLSKSADSFQVQRQIVFFNGITDKYLLTINGVYVRLILIVLRNSLSLVR
ncbi:hypothetical protein WKH57_01040 [Niallia taxi]|uniref:beta-sandwich lipoprotein n=1 Tax=Niallia taxi TaxID=2499688 RepID=UPI003173CDAF